MANLAAFIPSAKAPLVVREVETYKPGPHDLLIKNEVIAINPLDSNIANLDLFQSTYPLLIGGSFGGTVVEVGSQVTGYQVGDKVATFIPRIPDPEYAAYQRYALIKDELAIRCQEGVDLSALTSMTGNLSTVTGMFSGSFGLERPSLNGQAPPARGKKLLIYGGTSSLGSFSVQYLSQAGYAAVTTTSPRHSELVSKFGAQKVVDHTQDTEAVTKQLIAEGPYDYVIDCISTAPTVQITAAVLAAQGGGKINCLLPAFGPETLPDGVSREFNSWPMFLETEEKAELKRWTHETYLSEGLAKGKIIPLPVKKISGGLNNINEAIELLWKGVSGVKLIVHPWEE